MHEHFHDFSRIHFSSLVSTHRYRLKPARDGTEKSSQICQERLQPQKQCNSHASGPRLGHIAATQRPSPSVYDLRIAHEQVDIPAEQYLIPLDNRTRGHNVQVRQIPYSFTVYQQSFFPRTIILWNQLPQEAVSQSTLEAFQIVMVILTP